ncbi:hypothetical protein CVT24_005424 [Panaeolus cyanescens]|uniref:Beta-lactamase-related domain-containing protein n=1 Tax=Panaeolus cyanescens TaxID=181874 RepID=A0A409VQY2_9AGAR|nr:hypothetical protein CVT24_005424 [Panaeolus cyanescens]
MMLTTLSTEGRRALDEISRTAAETNAIAGFVYGATSLDGEIYFTSGGNHVVNDPTSGTVNPDTVFWICSMTKMLGHLAALLLIERGQLNEETPVYDFFPEFRNPIIVDNVERPTSNFKPATTVVTVKHLLNFTSGLVYPLSNLTTAIPDVYSHSYHEDEDPYAKFFELMKGPHPAVPLEFEPGTNFGYGYSSDVLGFIVEKITEVTLEEFMQKNIFKPLNLSSTSFYLTPELESRLLLPSHRRPDGHLEPWANHTKLLERDPAKVVKAHLSGVGIYSSLRDYLTLLRHLLQIYAGRAENPIAKRETIISMFEPTLSEEASASLEGFINHSDCQWSNALGVSPGPSCRKFPMPVSLSSSGRRALDELIRRNAERNVVPGFVYGVTSTEEEIFFSGGGNKIAGDPTSDPIDPDAVFWVCSMTKMIGHVSSESRLARKREIIVKDLTYDFSLRPYSSLSEAPVSNPQPAQTVLRVKHLLNFSSGLVYYPLSILFTTLPEPYVHSYHEDEDPYAKFFDLVKGRFSAIPLEFEPGTSFGYGYNSDVLGFIVEKISGKSLEHFLQENIFRPLGLTTMSFYLTPELESRLLPLTYRRDDGKMEHWANQTPLIERDPTKVSKLHLAGAGIYSSLRDYLSLLRHLLQIHAGTAENPILKRETVLSMFEPTLTDKGATSLETFLNHPYCQWSSAVGLASKDWPEGRKRGSGFWLGWANTNFHMDPHTGIATVFGTQLNPTADSEFGQIGAQLEGTLYDNLQRQNAERNVVPGFIFGATSTEGEIFFSSGGNRMASSDPIDQDAVFWICSMTKMVGHLAALQLIERGQLNEETPVSDYFPQFKNAIIVGNQESPVSDPQPAQTVLRVKHLLNFTSGLVYYPLSKLMQTLPESYVHSYHEDNDPYEKFFELVKGPFSAIPLEFEPGTNFGYGYSADVLGFIVEKVSGKSLEEYLQENVFKPLGLKISFYLTPELESRLLPFAHRRDDGSLEPWANHTAFIERDPIKTSKAHFAGIGLYASLRDYLSLLRHLLQIHAGTAQNPIAKRETVLSMFEPTLTDEAAKSLGLLMQHPHCQWSKAMGVASADWEEGRKQGSAFWSGWANTYFHLDPRTGIATVFGTQLHPAFDIETAKLGAVLERALYDDIQT